MAAKLERATGVRLPERPTVTLNGRAIEVADTYDPKAFAQSIVKKRPEARSYAARLARLAVEEAKLGIT